MGELAVAPPFLGQRTHIATTGVYGMCGGQSAGGGGSAAWPVANLAILCPVRLPTPQLLLGLIVADGATASGNFDMGVYSLAGARLYSTGSTAQTVVNAAQRVLLPTPLVLGAEAYYLAFAMDNTTGTVLRMNTATLGVEVYKGMGLAEAAAAFPLPNPIVPATPTQLFLPVVALLFRTTP